LGPWPLSSFFRSFPTSAVSERPWEKPIEVKGTSLVRPEKLIITVSVTGSFGDRSTPGLPITPKEIAESALEAYRAGAAVAHIHVRDVVTGKPSMEFKHYEEVVQRIRESSDMIINLSTGAGARFIPNDQDPMGLAPGSTLCIPQKRIEHVM
jgi:uncharacterized protein (DUF849 family)